MAQSYLVVDFARGGRVEFETIKAPHHSAAVRRAQMAAEGDTLQVWFGHSLVGAWRRIGPRSFERIRDGRG